MRRSKRKKNKIGVNEPCPCGSGLKSKKCCGSKGAFTFATGGGAPIDPAERDSLLTELNDFIDAHYRAEEEEAFDMFWGDSLHLEAELTEDLRVHSRGLQETWFAFDYSPSTDVRIVDGFLEREDLSPGERSYLEMMRRSFMSLYEVTDTVPGISMTLRDLVTGVVVTVNERKGSRTTVRGTCLAARVVPRGTSGGPEIEAGTLSVPDLYRESVLAEVRDYLDELRDVQPGASLVDGKDQIAIMFHDAWVQSIFEPAVPRLRNTDGEDLVMTHVSFEVQDADALVRVLDGAEDEGIHRVRDGESGGGHGDLDEVVSWTWSGASKAGKATTLASLRFGGDVLTAQAHSAARGKRARELVERLAGAAVQYRDTKQEDVQRRLREAVTAKMLGREKTAEEILKTERPRSVLPPELNEALTLQHLSQYYRSWIDEPVPALDGKTPRQAAKIRMLRPRVEDLIRGLEGSYEQALKDGEPAYDPSWMCGELELEAENHLSHPPPMAHERVAQQIEGSGDACRTAAGRLRASPAFCDKTTTVGEDVLRRDPELQRFLPKARLAIDGSGQNGSKGRAEGNGEQDEASAAPYLPLMVNFELHRRKTFWVDAALSYMLEHTDVDVSGGELRLPFPSFAVVVTDRHALSLGERLLARKAGDPLRGQILKVATVYVTERRHGGARSLKIVFAFDALGADLPSLVSFDVPAGDQSSLQSFLESVAPLPAEMAQPVASADALEDVIAIQDASPDRGLLRLVINAILYATSAGVTPETRQPPRRVPQKQKRHQKPDPLTYSSESVFYLPGTIDIRQVRQLQQIERLPEQRAQFARFMVRGHWRRAAKNWADQRLRWIEPYWKGPSMAAVIEKAYRLKP